MCRILIREKLKKSLTENDIEELISYALKIENFTKDNKGKNGKI